MSVGLGVSLSNFRVKSQVHKTYSCDIINNEPTHKVRPTLGPKGSFTQGGGKTPLPTGMEVEREGRKASTKPFFIGGSPGPYTPFSTVSHEK